MEPVTHVLTGACLARTGLNRRAAYATAGMAIAAEFPDIDTLWSLKGPIAGFQHHRGITHTFLGLPFEAALMLLGFWLYHRLRTSRAAAADNEAYLSARSRSSGAPVCWATLYALLLLALLSHLFLDYTNNYGLRPFFPFDSRWYAGSFVFIFDPLLFAVLLAGLLLPSLFGIVGREVGAPLERFQGRGWARAALVSVVFLWAVRWFEHGEAVAMAQKQTLRAPGDPDDQAGRPSPPGQVEEPGRTAMSTQETLDDPRPLLQPLRSLANPDPLSVFRWYTVTDFGPAYRLGSAETHVGTWSPGQILYKPAASAALLAAERSQIGRVYLDWSPMPALSVLRGVPQDLATGAQDNETSTTVVFRDPRFMGQIPWLSSGREPPLTGELILDQHMHVVGQAMDGRFDTNASGRSLQRADIQ